MTLLQRLTVLVGLVVAFGCTSGRAQPFPPAPDTGVSALSWIRNHHLSATYSTNNHGSGYPMVLYLGAGQQGIVRNIQFTFQAISNSTFVDWPTNISLRVYPDCGNVANLTVPPAAKLLFDVPLSSLMNTRFTNVAIYATNSANERWVSFTEWASPKFGGGGDQYAGTVKVWFPHVFTNGILVQLVNVLNGQIPPFVPNGGNLWSYCGYELGSMPSQIAGWRLMSSRATGKAIGGGFSSLAALKPFCGAGEFLSVFFAHHNAGGVSFWDGAANLGQWILVADGTEQPFGCAGGEDMSGEGFFISSGKQATLDWGTRFLNVAGYQSDSYHHFDDDRAYWSSNAWIQGMSADTANELVGVYLGLPEANPSTFVDTDAAAFLSAASITDTTISNAVVKLVQNAKRHGWWTRCDSIYPFVGGNATAHSKDLKGLHTITWNGSLTHDANGVKGDGTSGYGSIANLSTAGGQYQAAWAHMFVYVGAYTQDASFRIFMGQLQGTAVSLLGATSTGSAADVYFAGLNSINNDPTYGIKSGTNGYFEGPLIITRTNASLALQPWRVNAISSAQAATMSFMSRREFIRRGDASSAIPNNNLFVLGYDNNGTPSNFSTAQLRGASFGGGIDEVEWPMFCSDWETFEKDLSRSTWAP